MSGAIGYCSPINMDTRILYPGTLKEPSFVPPHIIQEAVSGNYVDLQEFLPQEFFGLRDNSITMKHDTDTDTFTFHRTLPAQPIENLTDWLRAWIHYERVLMNSNCSLYNELASYRDTILGCSRKFQWAAVYCYDRHFRASLGAKQSLCFGSIDHDLYVSVLDSDAVRTDVPRCHRCKSFDHKVACCPFPRANSCRRRPRQQTLCLLHPQSVAQHPPDTTPLLTVTTTSQSSVSSAPQLSITDDPPSVAIQSIPRNALPYAAHDIDGFVLSPPCSAGTSPLQQLPPSSPPSLPSEPSSFTLPLPLPTPQVGLDRTPTSAQPPAQVITSPVQRLNAEAFQRGLKDHSDQEFADYIVSACKEGVDIGYRGPRFYREFDNWPSASTFSDHIQADIDKDLASGIKIGPFYHPPFPNFVGSPMGAFLRKRSHKVRTIHDLSWKPGIAINDFISKDDFKIKYLALDDVISSIIHRGRHSLLAKLDLEAAFHHIPVRPQDFELLGSTFYRYNPVTNTYCKEYYYDRVLQFGARSSPKLFSDFATAAKHIMLTNGATYAEHYLDDYITMGAAGTDECLNNLNTMMDTCSDLGFSLNPNKICQPSTVMEYLGIILDTNLLQARISSERLEEVLTELTEWKQRTMATKRQILSLIGKLTFVSRVVRPGRTFVRRMISLASKVPNLHHRVSLTHEFQLDVDWWLNYLPQWNGVSLFPRSHWESSIELHLFTDSSDVAAAGYFHGAWFVVPFVYEFRELKDMSINWRELFAVVIAAGTFGPQWRGKRIMFHCDNMCVVEVVNSGTCRSDRIMDLVRKLFFVCAKYDFELSMCYINTHVNDIADALSRLQFDRFRQVAPHADQCMTMPVLMS